MTRAKNRASRTRPKDRPYEVWQTRDGSWTWHVLKKYQAPEHENEYSRWFVFVISPFMPEGEYGDEYAKGIKEQAIKVKEDYDD